VAAHRAPSSKPLPLPLSTPFMSNRKQRKASPQELLTLMDERLTALYRKINDPERPLELPDRICRFIRPTDLGKLV
jgi:hypothetical protein